MPTSKILNPHPPWYFVCQLVHETEEVKGGTLMVNRSYFFTHGKCKFWFLQTGESVDVDLQLRQKALLLILVDLKTEVVPRVIFIVIACVLGDTKHQSLEEELATETV